MLKSGLVSLSVLSIALVSCNLEAKETVVDAAQNVNMAISIYNSNLALVKDTRKVALTAGINEIAFEGVASQMKPETAMFDAGEASVIEQNYEYDLLNADNLLSEAIGETVKTARVNPADGSMIFDEAKVLNSNYGRPVLEFSYGIDADFPGRVIYQNIPDNLRVKPTLSAKLDSKKAGDKDLELSYLTNGMSWKADYVAMVQQNETMKLNGWVTLQNESGTDYKNAQIQVIAGEVNQVASSNGIQPRMMMFAKGAMEMDSVAASAPANIPAQAMSEYYLYTLPMKTDLANKQTKQVSLMNKEQVKYQAQYVLNSPLYVGRYGGAKEFEKKNPELKFKIMNDSSSDLGLPLPQGNIRFYENDAEGSLQFIGESLMPQLAVGESTELKVGQAFDIFAKGSVKSYKEISKEMAEAELEIEFNNAKSKEVEVKFEQNLNGNIEVLSENVKGESEKSGTWNWKVKVPANGKAELKIKLRLTQN